MHRRDDAATRERNLALWRYTAINGGVLVSPFISADERAVRDSADNLGGKLIHITNRPFAGRDKPAGRDFELCEQGRLLILAPLTGISGTLTRAHCLEMNRCAALIAGTAI